MSLGKCTYKYNLEKEIKPARGIAKQPNFLFVFVRIVEAITDESVWHDGKE